MDTKSRKFPEPQQYEEDPRPPIELLQVESSQVKAIGYDDETRTLAVAFNHGAGAIYHYPEVDRETFDAFLAAERLGSFFGKNIKALPFKKYPAEQVAA